MEGEDDQVGEFCSVLGGKRAIRRILIANNGMAAVKFIDSIKTWSYQTFGTDKAIILVALATPEDMEINAQHIISAHQFIQLPAARTTGTSNYDNVQLIVEIAELTRVDAVWPGWGHASENPNLPKALSEKGIIFLGPTSSSMAALGDKITALLIAQASQVPTLAWSGSHVKIHQDKSHLVKIPHVLYEEACVYTAEEAIGSCLQVGYPAMIKASWGGGGKGIRKVHNNDEVKALFKQVEGEVPGSPIFIMKVASQSRHLEVQLLCDQYGNVATLHTRDCSVQRRHQKIIEEGPVTVATQETIKKLEAAAARLAKSVNYVGAATVEYLYSVETGEYYFLEINPRLQVEHPVTEWNAQVNLSAAQVAVGMGIPLWKIPEIRRFYGMENGGGYDCWRKSCGAFTPFDFEKAECTKPKGHCIGVRITSEDPDDGFKPTCGRIEDLSFKSNPNVWAYFSVKSGGGIHEFSDSQFGHVFAFGESRELAIANMVIGLKQIQIRGQIRTNLDYTIDLLHALEYKENKIHTGWLDSRIAMKVRAERPPWHLSVVGGALYKVSASCATAVSEYIGYLEKGQIPPKHISLLKSQVTLNIEGSKYTINTEKRGPGSYRLRMNGSEIEAEMHMLCDGGLLMQLDGNSHIIYAEDEVAGTRLLIDGRICLLQNDHDPSKLVAVTSCKLLRYLVVDGSHIDVDTPYAEVEVMKMCMPLLSPASGNIHFKMSEGQSMQAGELIARLDLADSSAVRKAEPFLGSFPVLRCPTPISRKVHQQCAASLHAARMILAGYEHDIDKVVQTLLSCLDNPELPFLQWKECFSVIANRLPKDLRYELEAKLMDHEGFSNMQNVEFPANVLHGILEAHLNSCIDIEKGSQERLLEPLMNLVKSYDGGRKRHTFIIVQGLLEEYLSIEELFGDDVQVEVSERLRQKHKKNLLKVVDMVLSHQGIMGKNKLILCLIEQLVYLDPAAYQDQLIRFSKLNNARYLELSIKANQLLEQIKVRNLRSILARNLLQPEMSTKNVENIDAPKSKGSISEQMEALVNSSLAVEDELVGLFDQRDCILQKRVVETYIHRLYQPYLVNGSIRMQGHSSGLVASWLFLEEHAKINNGSEDQSLDESLAKKHNKRKWSAMVVIKSLEFLPTILAIALREASNNLPAVFPNESPHPTIYGNMMHIAIAGINNQTSLLPDSEDEIQAHEVIDKLAKMLKEKKLSSSLRNAGVGFIHCIIQRDKFRDPVRHSFHWSAEKLYYEEESLFRLPNPLLCIYLELEKLKGYDNVQYTPSLDGQWHLYSVLDKPLPIRRIFLRALVRQSLETDDQIVYQRLGKGVTQSLWALSFTSRSILMSMMCAMDELERYANSSTFTSHHAHIYLYILQEQQINDISTYHKTTHITGWHEEDAVEKILDEMAQEINASIGIKMHCLGVCEWEVKLWISSEGEANGAWRVVVTDITAHTCIVNIYREIKGSSNGVVFYYSTSGQGPLHNLPVNAQYKPLGILDQKRLLASKNNTTYCYDFPRAFEAALDKLWAQHPGIKKINDKAIFNAEEFIFADNKAFWSSPLITCKRQPGLNDIGLVAWRMEMLTPECPSGRTIIVISNDIIFKNGSFGPKENKFFQAVTNVACTHKLPLIYLTANSGAHISVVEEVKSCFKVGWSDESNPQLGFQYIFLTPEDYERIKSYVIAHELKLSSGESRWVIDTILGNIKVDTVVKEDNLVVQNVNGSGSIASAYSKAYKETFTLTYVTCRTVGIGAYLSRLGMRCIQKLDQPIILTGFSALNKVLNREVYSSHMQLGGPKVMATNGVVHLTVSDDVEGISSILKWLSFVPPYSGGPLPILTSSDPQERPVEYLPTSSCDPHKAICGDIDDNGKWLGGIFDKDSFIETLEGWAKTIVTGRARLGGIPVGIIAVETQTMMCTIPADPAQLDSCERVVPQSGQLLHPDSATKTAQAIMDFNREELPLFMLVNWRGFAGGQRDLFEGILQAGSTIVENLRMYQQPVFIYIPMMGELHGGGWVIVDHNINPDHIETYAERTAKGNILEPEGMIEIKFRTRELLECMGRLDHQLIKLKAKLSEARSSGIQTNMDGLEKQIKSRERQLLPFYRQIAVKFVELHGTSIRMAATGVVREVIEWTKSRYYFYKRLRRRIAENEMIKTLIDAAGEQLDYKSARDMIKEWYLDSEIVKDKDKTNCWMDDEAFFSWKDDFKNYEEKLHNLCLQKTLLQVSNISNSAKDLLAISQTLAAFLKKVDPSIRDQFIDKLRLESS